jgi:hypothetical protein
MDFIKQAVAEDRARVRKETYWALIKIYKEHESMFKLFDNEVDFASFVDNQITEKLKDDILSSLSPKSSIKAEEINNKEN